MNILDLSHTDINNEVNNDFRSMNKLSLYTIAKFLKSVNHFPKYLIDNGVLRNKEFTKTFQTLVNMSIIEQSQENGHYKLNSKYNPQDLPLLYEKYNQCSRINRDPYHDYIYT